MLDSSAEGRPQHKKKKTSLPLSFSLPDELALSCLARVSRSDYVALSLVSKRCRSLVFLPALYKTRSLLGCTEDCFYVCLSTGYESTPFWFILHRENRIMIPIPTLLSQLPRGSSVVALDGKIYVIGGWRSGTKHSSSDVFLLDCRLHTWHHVPSMSVPRSFSAAGVVDGKIYVIGGCRTIDLSLCHGEVFDPKTQTWETLVQITDHKTKRLFDYNHVYDESLVIEDKVYALHWARGVYYSPREAKWEMTENDVWRLRFQSHCCVTEKLLYGCDDYGYVFWCESGKFKWKEVKGLEALRVIFKRKSSLKPDPLKCCCKLRKFGANIMALWFNYNDENADMWCAEISFKRDEEEGEIWGTIEWSQAVATIDRSPSSAVEVLYSASINV